MDSWEMIKYVEMVSVDQQGWVWSWENLRKGQLLWRTALTRQAPQESVSGKCFPDFLNTTALFQTRNVFIWGWGNGVNCCLPRNCIITWTSILACGPYFSICVLQAHASLTDGVFHERQPAFEQDWWLLVIVSIPFHWSWSNYWAHRMWVWYLVLL